MNFLSLQSFASGFLQTPLKLKKMGLLLSMDIVKLPRIADYWSKDPTIYQAYPRTIMLRNRFELLLQMLHFSSEDELNKLDRL